MSLNVDAPSFQALSSAAGQGTETTSTLATLSEITASPCSVSLGSNWLFWWETDARREGPRAMNPGQYLKSLKSSSKFNNSAEILEYSQEVTKTNGKVMLFKEGIKPVWEDRANYNGGRFHLSCTQVDQTAEAFNYVVAQVLDRAFLDEKEICGFVATLKPGNLGVEVWVKNAKKKETIKNFRKSLKKLYKRNILFFVHRTTVNMQKQGFEAVKEQGMIDQSRIAHKRKMEEKSKAPVEPQPEEVAPKSNDTVLDALNSALVKAVISNAWKEQSSAPVPQN